MYFSNYVGVTFDVEALVGPGIASSGLFINHIFYLRCFKLFNDKRCEFSFNLEWQLNFNA